MASHQQPLLNMYDTAWQGMRTALFCVSCFLIRKRTVMNRFSEQHSAENFSTSYSL